MPGFNLNDIDKGVIGVLFYEDLSMSGGYFSKEGTKNLYAVVAYKDEDVLVVTPETENNENEYFIRPGVYAGTINGIRFDIEVTDNRVTFGYTFEDKADVLEIPVV